MKDISKQDFYDRLQATADAQRIFISSGFTNSIDLAWELYRDILAEKDFAIIITSDMSKAMNDNPFDKYPRLKCPVCQNDLYFRRLPENPEGIRTQLICASEKCDTVLNSEKTMDEWLEIIKNESQ
jgi:hypothetical protein